MGEGDTGATDSLSGKPTEKARSSANSHELVNTGIDRSANCHCRRETIEQVAELWL
ncbi:hypothetical protein [Baaleninema sp.]|uniref:hypothetical protein n=1 Tax=Baaleninema sp. TaxID=3101197 RepID=UPI003CFE908B